MQPVDLALVLAFDGSASVTFEEFNLIAGGCAAALRGPEVAAGLTGGPLGASLAAVVLWSGHGAQEVLVEWTRLGAPAASLDWLLAVLSSPIVITAACCYCGTFVSWMRPATSM